MTWPGGRRLVLDPRTKRLAGGRVLLGGVPGRLLRLGPAGPQALLALESGASLVSPAVGRLARSLVDAGLAHPRPGPVPVTDVTVVIPVKDRTEELDRCLSRLTEQAGLTVSMRLARPAGPNKARGLTVIVVDDGSLEPNRVAAVAEQHGAKVLHREHSCGPGVARNDGLAQVTTTYAAVVDSDVLVPVGWLAELLEHFADPQVAAVGPRVVGRPGPSLLERYAHARSPLDLGPRPALVRPGSPVSYLPTATVLLRLAALPTPAFDPALRYGEDVDLFWRLHDEGWLVRYDPDVVVEHQEPTDWVSWWRRRFAYGTSAAPLAERHPGRLTPLVLRPWPTAVAVLVLARRPALAAAVAVVPVARLTKTLRSHEVPRIEAATASGRLVVQGVGGTLLGLGSAAAVLSGPLAWRGASRSGRLRLLLLAPPLLEWLRRRPDVGPVSWTALRLADDAAYGAGVWWGCWRRRTLRPVLPSRVSPR